MTVWIDQKNIPGMWKTAALFLREEIPPPRHAPVAGDGCKDPRAGLGNGGPVFLYRNQKVGLHPAIKAAAGDLVQITLKGGEHFLRAAAPATSWYSGTIPALPLPFMPRIPRISAVRTSASTMPRAWAF